ncbi:MAG: DnaJ domain-containing protein, partial [Armatimonadota bacterium]|nr:DnaJ domain-containing protein [Armatimonadota bacterium]
MRPGDFTDYYEILGLASNASLDDVREAWRRAARLYHPDLNPRKTSFRFRRAKEAYDVLVDPARRRDYDRLYRLRKGVFTRSPSRRSSGSVVGTPPGGRTPPSPSSRPSGRTGPGSTRPAGASPSRPRPASDATRAAGPSTPSAGPSTPSSTRRPGAGNSPPNTSTPPTSGSTSAPDSSTRPPHTPGDGSAPGKARPVTGSRASAGSAGVRTRTSFRPATMFREAKGSTLIDQIKDAITQGGASRVAIRHNGKVIWETHVTSSLLDDITHWLVGPLSGLI